ncbi:MAG: DUF1848 family protein [Desulfobacteraceae bacterium]|nr:MAG: DUF1848 family protein [Desulfobacteraceae bacterium]
MTPKIVLSASRRTDIPAFYMDWFMERVNKGFFETVNPYNQKKSVIPASPDHVHTIVFWSKDFSRFIEGGYGTLLRQKGYHLFFNFTVNSDSLFLEPGPPALDGRMKQAEALCDTFGPATVSWRFDPICFYTRPDGSTGDTLHDFSRLAGFMAAIGVSRCITSFMDHYPKILQRPKPYPEFAFIEPDMGRKVDVLKKMAAVLASTPVKLYTCCEKDVLAALSPGSGVTASACIPSQLLADLFGGSLSFKQDTGQRIKQGCGCMVSTDIGIYSEHPCHHNCLFCYANPAVDKTRKTIPE